MLLCTTWVSLRKLVEHISSETSFSYKKVLKFQAQPVLRHLPMCGLRLGTLLRKFIYVESRR